MKMHGPWEIEIKVHLTDGDREAVATCGLARAGGLPSVEAIQKALREIENSVSGDEFRLMNKREFFNVVTRELTGSSEQFALPGGDNWDPLPETLAEIEE